MIKLSNIFLLTFFVIFSNASPVLHKHKRSVERSYNYVRLGNDHSEELTQALQEEKAITYSDNIVKLTAIKDPIVKSCFVCALDPHLYLSSADKKQLATSESPLDLSTEVAESSFQDRAGMYITLMCRSYRIYWLATDKPDLTRHLDKDGNDITRAPPKWVPDLPHKIQAPPKPGKEEKNIKIVEPDHNNMKIPPPVNDHKKEDSNYKIPPPVDQYKKSKDLKAPPLLSKLSIKVPPPPNGHTQFKAPPPLKIHAQYKIPPPPGNL